MRTWNQLTTAELYGFLRLRCDVFMWEQRADDAEMDGRDLEPTTQHWWIEDEQGVAAYLRVLRNAVAEYRDAHLVIGRVAVRADRRREGLAQALMTPVAAAFDAAGEASMLHAQSYAMGLYERLGFEVVGEEYEEAGIPHRSMYRAPVAGREADGAAID